MSVNPADGGRLSEDAETDQTKDVLDELDEDQRPGGDGARDWADSAAQARTASDPRRVAPHDASGVPTTEPR